MTLLQHYVFSLVLTTLVTSTLGLWVYSQKRNNKIAQIFCLYSLAVAFWSWCQAQAGLSSAPQVALAWLRAIFYAVITFPVLLIYFFSTFLGIDQKKVCHYGWFLVLGFMPFMWTELFLKEGGPVGFLPTLPKASILFLPFNIVWLGGILYAFWLLTRIPRNIHPRKEQANILLFAFIFGYITGCTNFLYIYGIYLPSIQPFATYGVPIAFFVIAYGVFIHGLFDVRLVIRKSLVYSILVTLLTSAYFGLVYGIEQLFRTTLGYQSTWTSLVAFAVMAITFQPLKISIQRLVDLIVFKVPREELVKRVERLEEQALQAEKFKTASTLAAGMAHEIKNPLTALKTFGEFLSERKNDPSFVEQCSKVFRTETDRIHTLVKEVLTFAKPKDPQIRPLDPEAVITSTVDLLSGELLKRRIKWETDYQHNGHKVQADPDQLRQVLINLIQNATDAMPGGGQLTITTQPVNGYLEMTVADTGEGIPKNLLPKVFDPFVTTKEGGNGLGLAMTYSMIRANHGSIRAENLPHCGSAFTVSLPV